MRWIGVWIMVMTGSQVALSGDDPYIWLEEISSERALSWVEQKNRQTLEILKSQDNFSPLLGKIEEVLTSSERIPTPDIEKDHVYNFWQDADRPRGVLRRTSHASYLTEKPEWETVLDVDALAEAESENWVYKGAIMLRPRMDRALVSLSRGGADATVVREFDLNEKAFVENGFSLEEAKSTVAWRDRDHIFVGTDFGAGSMTESGYPRVAKIWKRGTPLASAETLFEGRPEDVGVFVISIQTQGGQMDALIQATTFFTQSSYLIDGSELVKVDLPEDSQSVALYRNQLVVQLKSDWKPTDVTYRQGSLIAIDKDRFLKGARDFEVLVEPTERSSIASVSTTRSYLIVTLLENVTNRMVRYEFKEGQWSDRSMKIGALGTFSVTSSSLEHDYCFVTYTNFLVPSTLMRLDCASGEVERVKSQPAFFDATPYTVEQRFAKSKDGTQVPYFVVRAKELTYDGKNPTLLYGYGGFEVSMTPSYSATVGLGWLEEGGVYVLANIRGGGEYGPKWHQAALKKNRHKAYEDFIAVAEDLIANKITSPKMLGIQGGSNGGLLVGAVFTMRPELFGAVVCQVPLLDMKRFDKLLAGASWVAEYGDPDDEEMWEYIKTYSPYHNLSKDKRYPTPLFMTSTRDDRVHPGHARKMVAKMSEMGHPVYYYENIEGGHAGAANQKQRAFMSTLGFVYLLKQLKPKPGYN